MTAAGQQRKTVYGWRSIGLGLIGAALSLLSVPAIAHDHPVALMSPVPLDVDHWPERPTFPEPIDPNRNAPDDYLPAATPVATQLVLRLSERRVYVYGREQVLASYPVAIGTAATPTPVGEFEVFQMVVDPVWQSPWTGEVFPPGPDSALGLRWIGFAEQANGVIGFHGTPTLSSIGQAASNGCVRLRNEDVLALFGHVHLGMTVIVEP